MTKEKLPINIAVYGTLKRGYGANDFLRNSKFIGRGEVRKFALYGWGSIPYAFPTGKATDYVEVEVYQIRSRRLLKRLDDYEAAYTRVPVPVKLKNGKIIDAYMWVQPYDKSIPKKFYSYEDYLDYYEKLSWGDLRKSNYSDYLDIDVEELDSGYRRNLAKD